jgi:hypothetical protein
MRTARPYARAKTTVVTLHLTDDEIVPDVVMLVVDFVTSPARADSGFDRVSRPPASWADAMAPVHVTFPPPT